MAEMCSAVLVSLMQMCVCASCKHELQPTCLVVHEVRRFLGDRPHQRARQPALTLLVQRVLVYLKRLALLPHVLADEFPQTQIPH